MKSLLLYSGEFTDTELSYDIQDVSSKSNISDGELRKAFNYMYISQLISDTILFIETSKNFIEIQLNDEYTDSL